jgi:hypothetical protein
MSLEVVEDKEIKAIQDKKAEVFGKFFAEWMSCCLRCIINTQALSLGMAEPNCKKCQVPKWVRRVFKRHNRGYNFKQFWAMLDSQILGVQ